MSEESSLSCYSSLYLSSIDQDPLEKVEYQVTLELCSNSYFAWYLSKKLYSKFKCYNCADITMKSNNNSFYKRRTNCFTTFINMAQQIF